jgi:hypothetical protein
MNVPLSAGCEFATRSGLSRCRTNTSNLGHLCLQPTLRITFFEVQYVDMSVIVPLLRNDLSSERFESRIWH